MTDSNIKFGKPVLDVKYKTIKLVAKIVTCLNIFNIILAFGIFISAVKMKINVGSYINLVSNPEGNVLPTLLAIPGVLALPINVISFYLLLKVFSKKKKPFINYMMFAIAVICLASVLIFWTICILALTHAHSSHEALHDGITDAMKNYSSNSAIKVRVDMLQIRFQCCGSKKYDEWYDIVWYDTNLIKTRHGIDQLFCSDTNVTGEAPFSCCAMSSVYPCIHHGIESGSLSYSYNKEANLSLSSHGCHAAIIKAKKSIGWKIVGRVFGYSLLQLLVASGLRLLQTAHYERSSYGTGSERENREYTMWIIGCYQGKPGRRPPPVPPLPPELMD